MENQNPQLAAAISAELEKHFVKVKEVHTALETEVKDNKRISEGMKDTLAELNKSGATIIAKQAEYERKTDERILDLEQKAAAAAKAPGSAAKPKSVGQQFVESKSFKDFQPTGMRSVKASSSPFEVKSITSLVGSGGPGIFPEYLPQPVIPAFQPLTIRDLLAIGTTESNTINWVQELVFTNNAGYQGSDGALKPQSDITYQLKTIPVETIGHWIKASKQVLADFKVLETLIDNRLNFGLKFAEEQQILYGDGAVNHIHGLIPQATAYNQGYLSASSGPPIIVGDTKLDTLRRAMLQVTEAFYPSTGIALSPADWADIELTKDSLGRYVWSSPTSSNPGMIWGLPVAQCFSMQRGDFLVGAFKLAAVLFDREQSTILLSTEDQDNFVRNMVTILAEERIALAVSRPAAIVYGAFKAGETG
jgi:HK97 family phage major capsid protein